MATENQFYSYNSGELPEGCQLCVRGEKVVLFVTGLCPRRCYFCPVSDQKYGNDVCYANERAIISDEDLLQEVEAMDAKGAGITGGDPLMKLDRTVHYIKLLKEKKGKSFHIHLYTSLNLVTQKGLQQLFDAGLDEIRFHLDFDSTKFWDRLALARQFSWKIGVELPLIPTKEKELWEIVQFVHDTVDFLNLNELEVADNSQSKLGEMGFSTKDTLSYAVEDSLALGKKILEKAEKEKIVIPIHVCTARLKDAVQLANRFKREALGLKKPFDVVGEEGELIRGALYLPELAPGFEYRKKLAAASADDFLPRLEMLVKEIKSKLKFRDEQIFLDKSKLRILVSQKSAKHHTTFFHRLGLKPAIVVEYPTADQLEIEVEFV
ncbi:TPA: radical SAM protein [Candidatus Woesearchaeota archaeon]|nr:radical SAM protein [Candidatus Woesearchaeota archaeon]